MRTNIDIDDTLLNAAMSASGLSTKKATVEEALRLLVKLNLQRQSGMALAGVGWDGDLQDMRLDQKQ
jgi:Arc/MetJ family transcription regulator